MSFSICLQGAISSCTIPTFHIKQCVEF
uniref:Uncharacterized protein n=1 Tax=Rhizophora mucronata TaxID=61149 RepID=A0A2P2NW60_RHIMU